jgi:hypothetical protein
VETSLEGSLSFICPDSITLKFQHFLHIAAVNRKICYNTISHLELSEFSFICAYCQATSGIQWEVCDGKWYNTSGINNKVNNMALIKKSEYARKSGVSKSYISKLIRQGKIALCDDLIDEDKMTARTDLKRQLLEAKLNNEIFKGQILKAKSDALAKEYVSAEDVKNVVNARSKIIRDTLLQIPDRVSSAIASLKDVSEIHALLMTEIRNTLFKLSNDTTV